MPVRSLLLHILLCFALVANGVGAAWAGTRGPCCDHVAQMVAAKAMPCHDATMAMPPSDAPHAHGMPAHDGHPAPPHTCDGHCVCMTQAAGTLPPAPPSLAAAPARDTLSDAPARPHAPPALPHPLRPPIRA